MHQCRVPVRASKGDLFLANASERDGQIESQLRGQVSELRGAAFYLLRWELIETFDGFWALEDCCLIWLQVSQLNYHFSDL